MVRLSKWFFLLSVLLFLPLASCGSEDDEPDDPNKEQQSEEPGGEPEQPEEKVLTKDDIADFDKIYIPRTYNEGFSEGLEGMLKKGSQWSFYRCRQSEHFIVFWEPGFGDDPGATKVPWNLRVNIDDLLKRAEEFYTTNVEKLKMVDVSGGQSRLNDYKIQIYLKYQTEWLATGAGYDNRVGALWVNPSTCQPAGSTIAHEVGHTFQYLVYCDHLKQGEYSNNHSGFRYGFGANGSGGCGFWEQCAQWQMLQDYPRLAFNYQVDTWLRNQHRHFCHEYMRYASYWLQFYWVQEHGITAVSRVWNESVYPEDPLETYQRLFCEGSLERLYEELYDYAARMVTYDIDGLRDNATAAARKYVTTLYRCADGSWQVAYGSCPGTTGFNVIRLNVDEDAAEVRVDLEALNPGSGLHADDPGTTYDADHNRVSSVRTYNGTATAVTGFRYGFVAVDGDGKATYSPMCKGKKGTALWTVPEGCEELYLVVLGAPEEYHRLPWDDDETTDEQWPYRVSITGATIF